MALKKEALSRLDRLLTRSEETLYTSTGGAGRFERTLACSWHGRRGRASTARQAGRRWILLPVDGWWGRALLQPPPTPDPWRVA